MLAVLCLSWLFIAGLGALPVLALGRVSAARASVDIRLLSVAWSYGLSFNYLSLLVLRSLAATIIVGCVAAAVGGGVTLWLWRDRWRRPRCLGGWIAAFVFLVLAIMVVVIDPLDDDDARSLWFFHAKAIFFAGGLWRDTGLAIHRSYPLLLPGLAAQVSEVIGYWNEYLPKFAMVLLLPVPILAVLGLVETPASMAFVGIGFLAVTEKFIGNGSMDGYLALYAGAGALYLADWLERHDLVDLLAAAGAFGVAGGLKQEAQVIYLAIGLSSVALLASRRVALPRMPRRAVALAFLPFSGFVLWQVMLHLWSFQEHDYSLASAWPRLADPHAWWQIIHHVLFDHQVVAATVLFLIVSAGVRTTAGKLPSSSLPALLAGVLCILAFCPIFLMSNFELGWALGTGADRVVKSGTLMIVAAAIVVLRSQERRYAGTRPPSP